MASRLQQVKSLLEKIKSSKPIERKLILKNLSNKEVKYICEVCLNVCRGNVAIGPAYSKLKRQRKLLTALADKKRPIKTKRKIINQKGGFVGALVATLLPIVASEVYRLVRK